MINKNQIIGLLGEHFAAIFLAWNGYTVVDRRWKNRFGEIDIIAKKKNTVFIVEVKTRKLGSNYTPIGAIDAKKRENLKACSTGYLELAEARHMRQRIKTVEYMMFGVPIIASDFPLWREIVEGRKCGICVDPKDPKAIAAAIKTLLTDPQRAQQLSKNGIQSIKEKYNWENEKLKLVHAYKRLLPEKV